MDFSLRNSEIAKGINYSSKASHCPQNLGHIQIWIYLATPSRNNQWIGLREIYRKAPYLMEKSMFFFFVGFPLNQSIEIIYRLYRLPMSQMSFSHLFTMKYSLVEAPFLQRYMAATWLSFTVVANCQLALTMSLSEQL